MRRAPFRPMSVLELVRAGTLDLRLAGLLWLIMEHRASVLVAAGPSAAGKTTTLNVMLDFLPPRVRQVHLRGFGEGFGFLCTGMPSDTYIVAEEFSNHGRYIWGDTAIKAFQLLAHGYSLGGTMHAGTAEEVVHILREYLGLPSSLLSEIGAIITLRLVEGTGHPTKPVRWVDTVSLIAAEDDGVSVQTIAARQKGNDTFVLACEDVLQRGLSTRFDMCNIAVGTEIAERQQFLGRLLTEDRVSRDEVREAIVEFYGSRS